MKLDRLFTPVFIIALLLLKQPVTAAVSSKNDSLFLKDSKPTPELACYGITAAEYNSLPASIKKKIPQFLQKSDSMLVKIALFADHSDKEYPQNFMLDEFSGTIHQTKGNNFEVRNSDSRLLGLIHKSKDAKKRVVTNASGNVVYNDMGLNGFAYVGMGFGALLVVYALYALIYLSWIATID